VKEAIHHKQFRQNAGVQALQRRFNRFIRSPLRRSRPDAKRISCMHLLKIAAGRKVKRSNSRSRDKRIILYREGTECALKRLGAVQLDGERASVQALNAMGFVLYSLHHGTFIENVGL
jgi:hypothetical protein